MEINIITTKEENAMTEIVKQWKQNKTELKKDTKAKKYKRTKTIQEKQKNI